ncbi:MAG: hypothetical protein ACRDK0_11655 [Solirubrobacteraceae bacterium]
MIFRACLIAAGAALACAGAPSTASARIVEVGQAAVEAAPTCPANPCLAVSRTTGYQAKVVDSRATYVVPADGKIVAFTIRLGAPNRRQIDFFEDNFGKASAGLSVIRRRERLFGRVVAASPIYQLSDYFGQTVQFPLDRAINVRRGSMIGLTVPTWAPALSTLVDDGSSWRASRQLNGCDNTDRQTAQTSIGALTQYRCLYKARLTYTATLVTNPKPNKKPGRQKAPN